jgi:GTPase Era involved in 16S rRNA processing
MIPEFAILGHPNEGKSSVLSTLAEDDSVRVSPTPGETIECRTFPVIIDGRELLRFTDTPGFQNPGRVLSELRKRSVNGVNPLTEFREYAKDIPELHDDRELLGPLERGAGIIYVVDGSRPVRNVDRAEMEILRLTGKPRMAIINCKDDYTDHLETWKNEFRKNFNSNRLFNAHRATYAERIHLLEALKSIDQDWHKVLSEVVAAFKKDWASRNSTTTDIITGLLTDCLSLQLSENISSESEAERCREKLLNTYSKTLIRKEKIAHQRIRDLFKHNIFDYQLPPHSILHEELFDERSWQFLGLTKKQVIIAGGLGGAAIGAGLDVAALGHGLGLFTAVGSVAGALGAIFGGENFSAKARLLGVPLGGEQVQIGPAKSIDLLFVLLNRSLLYYQHTINWAHGRRDHTKEPNHLELQDKKSPQSFTHNWSTGNIKVCHDFFKAIGSDKKENGREESKKLRQLILTTLREICESE